MGPHMGADKSYVGTSRDLILARFRRGGNTFYCTSKAGRFPQQEQISWDLIFSSCNILISTWISQTTEAGSLTITTKDAEQGIIVEINS